LFVARVSIVELSLSINQHQLVVFRLGFLFCFEEWSWKQGHVLSPKLKIWNLESQILLILEWFSTF